ncbi:MAG: M48 family metallopeptidase [Hyphomicrobiales bacterium]|nr:M48 family metallopeptidase [Hyphomicrobiales bacterium]
MGGSSPQRQTIRLNLELAKKHIERLDYVILHEMAHFIVPHHGEDFVNLHDQQMPNWRHVRKRLNDLPLGHARRVLLFRFQPWLGSVYERRRTRSAGRRQRG